MSPHALAHPAGLAPCSSCERARELARQILALRPGTVEAATLRPVPMPTPMPAPFAPAAPAAPLAPAASGFDPDGKLAELSRSLAAKQRELERIQDSYRHVVDANQRMSTDLAERESRLNQVQAQIDSLRGDLSSAGQRLDTNKSQITSLMQSLEVTKDEAANHQRMLNEQSAQFSAAHSMLHRLGPLLQALETEATATARPPGRPT
jgi:septal ring factor EnvC (AmiA/AmiB activator)